MRRDVGGVPHWDSAFRDRGLAVEDRIVAMNGVPLALRERISPASASGPMR
jgi:hypothetical protein